MKVLVGCEKSQTICKAFRKLGIEAYSNDVLPSIGNPAWHLQCDVFEAIDKIKPTLLIAHPDCKHLASSGAKWFKDKQARQIAALYFVRALMDVPVPHICIENPVSVISTHIRKADQIIQPYEYGDSFQKTTCLWLKNLPLLKPTNIVDKGDFHILPDGRKISTWYSNNKKIRSTTFPGIAKAIAEQYTEFLKNKYNL